MRRVLRTSAIVFPAWVTLTLAPVSATHHPQHASHHALAVGPNLDDVADRHGMLVRNSGSIFGGVPPSLHRLALASQRRLLART